MVIPDVEFIRLDCLENSVNTVNVSLLLVVFSSDECVFILQMRDKHKGFYDTVKL